MVRRSGSLRRGPGCPQELTPCRDRSVMREVEGNGRASSAQLGKSLWSQTGVSVSCDTIGHTLHRGSMHGYHPQREPTLKPTHIKALWNFPGPVLTKAKTAGTPNFGVTRQRYIFLCLWWIPDCMTSQGWGVQWKTHDTNGKAWWWQYPCVGLHECCRYQGAAFHPWYHEFTDVLWHNEREDETTTPCPWGSCTFTTGQWSKTRI